MEDVLWARQEVGRFIAGLPFTAEDRSRIEVIVSELASNMVKHAGHGTLRVERLDARPGVRLVAEDHGRGIADLERALQRAFSTAGSFGDGLPMVREMADRFAIDSAPGQGTRVEVEKWAV